MQPIFHLHPKWQLIFRQFCIRLSPHALVVRYLAMACCCLCSVQDGMYADGKAHMRSTPSLRSFPKVAFKMVPMFVWLTMARSRPFREDRLTPLSSRRSMVWCPWLCARRGCLKLLNTSDPPRSKPLVRVALPASLFCSVISLHSGMPRAVDPHYKSKSTAVSQFD